MKHFGARWCLAMAALGVVGCATAPAPYQQSESQRVAPPSQPVVQPRPEPPAPEPAPQIVAPEPSESQKSLVDAIASFDRGEYRDALRQLSPLTNDASLSVPERLKALKTLAFSQCLTQAVVACRLSFERAFKLDPEFDLAPTEQGHPVWGKQFLNAKSRAKKN